MAKKKEKTEFPFKKISLVLIWILTVVGIISLTAAAIKKQNANSCKSLKIKIDSNFEVGFVNEKEVLAMLSQDDEPTGKKISTFDFARLERRIETNSFVEEAEVFMNTKGELSVDVKQKVPIVRVINKNGVDYYIDKNRKKMFTSPNFTARVIVATGNISDNDKSEGSIDSFTLIKNIFTLAEYLHENEFWNAMIQQIYVNDEQEFELIPRLGNYSILLGEMKTGKLGMEEMKERFKKLMIFYKETLNKINWSDYQQINLKYKNQIICKKI